MKKLACVIAAAALIATAAQVVLPAAAAPKAPRAAIAWGRCDDASLRKAGAKCAMLDVPLDYSNPGGTQIQIALSRVKHTTPIGQYQGVMLVNPGGPGGSGLGLATLGQYVPKNAGDAYDWIGFDPRGVGSSVPAISCIPDYFHGDRPPYVPVTKKLVTTWRTRSEHYANRCDANASALLQHMTTIDAAKDMDSIRQALGVAQINYFGFSYGTYLGQVYATLFPGNIRRAVFDANVDPRNVWYQANLNQDIAFQRNIEIWFRWVAKYNRTYHLGKTGAAVEKQYYAVARAHEEAGRRRRRSGRVERRDPVRRVLPGGLDLPRGRVLQLGQRPRCQGDRRRVPVGRRSRQRQRVRRVQRGPVHRRPVAPGLEHVAPGQLGHLQEGPVRDVGQRMVQRALPLLGRPRRRAHHGERGQHTGAADRRDFGRGHAVSGQPLCPQRLPGVESDRGAGRNDARRIPLRQRVRRQQDRAVPGDGPSTAAAARLRGRREVQATAEAGARDVARIEARPVTAGPPDPDLRTLIHTTDRSGGTSRRTDPVSRGT